MIAVFILLLNALENNVYGITRLSKFQSFRRIHEIAEIAVSLVMSVRLPVRPRGKLGFHWMGIHKILCWEYLLKYVEKIQGWLQLHEITGHFTWRPKNVRDDMSLNSCWNKTEASGKGGATAARDHHYGAEKIRFVCRVTGAKIRSVVIFCT